MPNTQIRGVQICDQSLDGCVVRGSIVPFLGIDIVHLSYTSFPNLLGGCLNLLDLLSSGTDSGFADWLALDVECSLLFSPFLGLMCWQFLVYSLPFSAVTL